MANLTIAVDDDLLRKARIRSAELGTSVNAVLRAYLEEWTDGKKAQRRAIARFVAASRRSKADSGGRKWTRDELHER
jgi:plasmid stability protein